MTEPRSARLLRVLPRLLLLFVEDISVMAPSRRDRLFRPACQEMAFQQINSLIERGARTGQFSPP